MILDLVFIGVLLLISCGPLLLECNSIIVTEFMNICYLYNVYVAGFAKFILILFIFILFIFIYKDGVIRGFLVTVVSYIYLVRIDSTIVGYFFTRHKKP